METGCILSCNRLCTVGLSRSCQHVVEPTLDKIIYIADPEILAITIEECGEPLVDLKDQAQIQYGPVPENEFTANCYTKMRKTVYDKLCRAQDELPAGLRLRLYEGFRSLAVQGMLFEQEYNRLLVEYPAKSHAEIFHEATRLASPVKNFDGSLNVPPHNTGAAVDIEIITEEGELIDMGMAAKDWLTVDPDLCLSNCQGISLQAKQHRRMLYDVMTAQGFINYPTEWWHFSYGDRYWAYHKGSLAIYGPADKINVLKLKQQ